MADVAMDATVQQSCEKGAPSGPPAMSSQSAGLTGPPADSAGPPATQTPDEQAKLLLLQRRSNTVFANWLHSLAPADARKAVLKKADTLASNCSSEQIAQLSALLVSDSYGGDATAEMVLFKVREAYNARSLGCKLFLVFLPSLQRHPMHLLLSTTSQGEIWIGSIHAAGDVEVLRKNGITAMMDAVRKEVENGGRVLFSCKNAAHRSAEVSALELCFATGEEPDTVMKHIQASARAFG
eukprot:s2077_g14.t1